jgi:hypothetical protein
MPRCPPRAYEANAGCGVAVDDPTRSWQRLKIAATVELLTLAAHASRLRPNDSTVRVYPSRPETSERAMIRTARLRRDRAPRS